MEYSSAFVCLMGMGTVFFGLICLIVLTMLMGKIVGTRACACESGPRACRIRSGTEPSGAGSRSVCRDCGRAGDRYHRRPHSVHEKTVRNE